MRLNPNSSKIAHFPIKNFYDLHFKTTPQNQFFPTVPHTYFSNKFRTTFNFIEVFTEDKPDICATLIQNSTNQLATLPTGHIGYIEVNEKPRFYQVHDINTLIHNVTHTYHPEITETIPQTRYSSQYKDDTTSIYQFSLPQVYMTDHDIPKTTSSLYNVQPTSYTRTAFSRHYHIQQKISNLLTNSTFNSLTLPTLNILHFKTYYLITKHAMQHIKLMLAKLQLPFEFD